MHFRRALLALLFLALPAAAQLPTGAAINNLPLDGAPSEFDSIPVQKPGEVRSKRTTRGALRRLDFGTALPATCSVGDEFFDTDADTNGAQCTCRATNTWKCHLPGTGGGGGGASTAAPFLLWQADGTGTLTNGRIFVVGSGLDAASDGTSWTVTPDSQESGFLADGGATPLTGGAGTAGKIQVLDNGQIEYVDGAGILRRVNPLVEEDIVVNGADLTGTADSTTAILATVAAAEANNRTITMPCGTFRVIGSGSTMFTVTEPLRVKGASTACTRIMPASSVPATRDVFVYDPANNAETTSFPIFTDFTIYPETSGAARHGIVIRPTGTGEYVARFAIERVRTVYLGGFGFYLDGSDADAVGVFTGWLHNVQSNGNGLGGVDVKDSITCDDCNFAGVGYAVDMDFSPNVPGKFTIQNSNITASSGVRIGGPVDSLMLLNSYFEPLATFSGADGAYVNITGSSAWPNRAPVILGNKFGNFALAGTPDALRLDYTDSAWIEGNEFLLESAASDDIVLTANAARTHIGMANSFFTEAPGAPRAPRIVNSGTATENWANATGVPRFAVGVSSFDAGISHLASSTSAHLAGVLSDETGSGFSVFGTSPTLLGNILLDNQAELRFSELDANGANYLSLKAPAAVTTNRDCVLEDDASFIPDACVGDGVDDGGGGGGGAPVDAPYLVTAPNATLTGERVATAAAGIKITDDGTNLYFFFNFDPTLATSPALSAEECMFTKDGSGSGGFICEGTIPDTAEQLYLFPASNGADTTSTFALIEGDLGAGSQVTDDSHNHTGTSISALDTADITTGTMATARLGSGTANNTTFLRGDNTWAVPSGGGGGTASRVHLRKSAAQSISVDTDTAITWDTEDADTDSFHDNSSNTSRITFASAGSYLIILSIDMQNSTSGDRSAWIRLNGTTVLAGMTPKQVASPMPQRINVTILLEAAAGDYVEGMVRTSAVAINVQANTGTNFQARRMAV